jgi:hypothetical protein
VAAVEAAAAEAASAWVAVAGGASAAAGAVAFAWAAAVAASAAVAAADLEWAAAVVAALVLAAVDAAWVLAAVDVALVPVVAVDAASVLAAVEPAVPVSVEAVLVPAALALDGSAADVSDEALDLVPAGLEDVDLWRRAVPALAAVLGVASACADRAGRFPESSASGAAVSPCSAVRVASGSAASGARSCH